MLAPSRGAAALPEQTKARTPDADGFVERDGVRVHWEVYGDGRPAILLMPTWSIVHSRHWKGQIPYLARHGKVVTFDGRGNGRSDRPVDPTSYVDEEFVADTIAVMDATGTERAVVVSLSRGAVWTMLLAADHPERVVAAACIAPAIPLTPMTPERVAYHFNKPLETDDGWAKFNRHYWLRDYRGFAEFFFANCSTEPHSTKQIEDCVGWALDTTPEALIATQAGYLFGRQDRFHEVCGRVRCPVLVLHGDEDAIRPLSNGEALAETTGGRLVVLEGSGHLPHARDPVKVNVLLREFVESVSPERSPQFAGAVAAAPEPSVRRWTRARNRRRRALYVSSPIGLGHARRDAAIADHLRQLVPDLEIDWLAQHPVTEVLTRKGERIHPASRHLASESAHFQHEAHDHDLHAFQAIRRMDEILVANFMVFDEVVAEDGYDLVVGDEAWDVDYFWHENPERKRTAFAWMTDFVGWIPMPDGGEPEAALTADYNAEMIEQIARYPRIRDRAIFVGNPDDVVPRDFGPGLPRIRDWVVEHYAFSGYITGFDPAGLGDRDELRRRLGYRPDERVVLVTVGGSGVGTALLRRVAAAFPDAATAVDGLRMIAVTGPRIDPRSLDAPAGVEVVGYIPDLHRHLAACDLAVVQGGLTTCMELTACRRPFLYFPLRNHFEQNVHVAHRLDRYGAGRRMDFTTATPEVIAAAIASELGREVTFRPVETDGAARAATLIAQLI